MKRLLASRALPVLIVVLVLVGSMLWYLFGSHTGSAAGQSPGTKRASHVQSETGIRYDTVDLRVGSQRVTLDVADTAAKQELGLGKRSGIAPNGGMLFSYPRPGQLCFWMKDMKFPIDIVWLDAQKRVIHVEPNLSPDTYPKTYCPDQPAQYVIELYPGAAQASFRLGDKLML